MKFFLASLMGAVLAVALLAPANARTHRTRAPVKPAAAPAAPGARAGGPSPLGSFQDWSAYTRGTGDAKVCYALSEPKTKEPARAKRDPVYFLINDWPGRHSQAEAEIVPGYPYRDGSSVTVQVGGSKFSFFTKNQGSAGGAWVLNPTDQPKLMAAMRNGSNAIVTGTSRRGTQTRDTYSLTGMGDALAKIHQACGM
jgi:invasion protein IalB